MNELFVRKPIPGLANPIEHREGNCERSTIPLQRASEPDGAAWPPEVLERASGRVVQAPLGGLRPGPRRESRTCTRANDIVQVAGVQGEPSDHKENRHLEPGDPNPGNPDGAVPVGPAAEGQRRRGGSRDVGGVGDEGHRRGSGVRPEHGRDEPLAGRDDEAVEDRFELLPR